MPSKVVFLGAGASLCAGYPLANDLLPAVEANAIQSHIFIRQAWQKWKQFRDASTGPLELALKHSNPEVVLSQIDLLETTKGHFADHIKTDKVEDAFQKSFADEEVPPGYFKSDADREIWPITEIRYRIIDCLENFFRYRHYCDSLEKNRTLRDYLRKYLSWLNTWDLVITLNWDTTVERTLAELGRWNPLDGYGFRQQLMVKSGLDPAPLPQGCENERSEIKVLKLHGSVGWHLTGDHRLYFSNPYFLDHFDFHYNGKPLPLVDPLAPDVGPDRERILAYPSFLKKLDGCEIQWIWHRAAMALQSAKEIQFIGYSLPESDLAIRVLLGPLRFRLESEDVSVTVQDPSGEVRDRWRTFLGDRIKLVKRPFC